MHEDLPQKYPLIFSGKYGGLCVGNGWHPILDAMCANIQSHIQNRLDYIEWAEHFNTQLIEAEANGFEDWPDWKSREPREILEPIEQVMATQVKEKFGSLRFYYSGGDDHIRGVVNMAESMSLRMCEVCGAPGIRSNNGGWIRTVCEEHK